MTVLVTTHYMDEAEQYCDRVALMHKGRIRALGTPDELKAELPGEYAAPSLEDVFRYHAGSGLQGADNESDGEDFRDVRRTRNTANRVR